MLITCNNTDACQWKQGCMQGLCQTQGCLLSLLRANYSDHTLPTTASFEKHPHTVLLWIVFSFSRSPARNSPIFHLSKFSFSAKRRHYHLFFKLITIPFSYNFSSYKTFVKGLFFPMPLFLSSGSSLWPCLIVMSCPPFTPQDCIELCNVPATDAFTIGSS